MSFPRYPEYKDSGVAWLGDVPVHWNVVPIKRLACLKGGAGFPHEEQGKLSEDLGFYKVAALANARPDSSLMPSEDTVSRETADRLGAHAFPPGTIVFAKVGAALLLGRIRKLATEGCIDNNMMGAVVSDPNDVNFLVHALSLVKFDLIANPGAVPSLNIEQIGNYQLPSPPENEQRAIVAFLDRETAKIDGLIAEQERLVALLKEKRQALISHAVTKGLDPNAPMKDSGIEWLGQVPDHWEILRTKRFTLSTEQGWSPLCENFQAEGDEWAVLKVGCVNGGQFNRQENKVLPAELDARSELSLKAGDLLISRANTRELVGSAAVVGKDEPFLLLCDKLYRLRLDQSKALPEFVAHYLSTPEARGQIELDATGASASMVNIGQATILEMSVPMPPILEQEHIVRSLSDSRRELDRLVEEAQRAITLLKERRAALISAAVTGKIDVRDKAASNKQDESRAVAGL